MSKPTDDLYVRYMRAFEDSTHHTNNCAACHAGQDCPEGAPIHQRFHRLQDVYRARQSKQQRR
jgi:predicted aldo/keto reductase-like oxidoreductase